MKLSGKITKILNKKSECPLAETIREKRIRYILIVFFVLLTAWAILSRTNKTFISEEKKDEQAKVVVLQQAQAHSTNNPQIAMYKKQNGSHVLTHYEIELQNQFHFKAKGATTLKSAPTELAADKSGVGFWGKIKNKWKYFNEELEITTNETENIADTLGQSHPFEMDDTAEKVFLTIKAGQYANKQITLENKQTPLGLYPLAQDGTMWLILYEDDINIAIASDSFKNN